MLPVEQPRRKREVPAAPANRRMNALKHQTTHPTANPAVFKDAFGGAKIGKFPSPKCRPMQEHRAFIHNPTFRRSRERCECYWAELARTVRTVGGYTFTNSSSATIAFSTNGDSDGRHVFSVSVCCQCGRFDVAASAKATVATRYI